MASDNENDSGQWDKKSFIVGVLSLVFTVILGILALLFTVATPELRKIFCLEKDKPAPQPHVVQPQPLPTPVLPTPAPVVQEKPSKPAASAPPKPAAQTPPSVSNDNPSDPTEYTLAEHERQFIKEANTELSFSFNSIDGVSIVSLVISPVGKTPLTRAVLNGRSHEFNS